MFDKPWSNIIKTLFRCALSSAAVVQLLLMTYDVAYNRLQPDIDVIIISIFISVFAIGMWPSEKEK